MAFPWLVSQGRKQPPYVEKKRRNVKILGELVEIDFDFNRNHPQKIRLNISDISYPDYLHNVLPTQTTMLGGSSQPVSGL